jgi:transcriptional regulator with XRE-family HTH domain
MAQEAAELTPAQIIGENVHVARRRRHWTQAELADQATKLGVKIGEITVSRIEGGRRRLPPWNELLALSVALGTDPIALGAREEDYPELALTRELIERIRCSVKLASDLRSVAPPHVKRRGHLNPVPDLVPSSNS